MFSQPLVSYVKIYAVLQPLMKTEKFALSYFNLSTFQTHILVLLKALASEYSCELIIYFLIIYFFLSGITSATHQYAIFQTKTTNLLYFHWIVLLL